MAAPPFTLPIEAIQAGSQDARIVRAVGDLFAQVDAETARRAHQCRECGRCCRFVSYDHQLFVTPMELSYLVARVGPIRACPTVWPGSCVYQVTKICSIHAYRLLGCRVFFCHVADGDEWQYLGEQWHRALADLHITYCVPYYYIEWGQALRQLGARRAACECHRADR